VKRGVRFSKTARRQFNVLLDQGLSRFGALVVAKKQTILLDAVDTHLAEYPRTGQRDRRLQLYIYPVTGTPFVVIYDFDETTVRVFFIVHERADRRLLDRARAAW
jgi:plasmid stabilization system protein ParE